MSVAYSKAVPRIGGPDSSPKAGRLRQFGEKAHAFAFRPPAEDARVNILEGSIRSSKTTAMIPKRLQLCRYPVEGHKLIVGVSKQTVYNNVLSQMFELVGKSNYTYNRQTGELTLCGSKWIVCGAKDEGSEKFIRGLTLGVADVDEAVLIPKSFWQMMIGRLSAKGARAYATTNPGPPQHYLKKEWLDDPEKRQRGDVWSQHFTLDDNPNVDEEYKAFVKRSYSGMFYKRFVLGLWVGAEGAIYADSFTDDLIVNESQIPIGLRGQGGHVERIIACDYGTKNAMVFLEILDDGKILWVVREYYFDSAKEGYQQTDAQYGDALVKFIKDGAATEAQVIIDPSAASFKAEMNARGIWNVDGNNDVLDGIRMVSTMFQRKLVRVHEDCRNFIEEHQGYVWDEKKAAYGVEEPVNTADHTCAAFRYEVKTKISDWRLAA